MSDSLTYANKVVRDNFDWMPAQTKDKIRSAIRIAWIDGGLDQIEKQRSAIAETQSAKNLVPSQVKGLDL